MFGSTAATRRDGCSGEMMMMVVMMMYIMMKVLPDIVLTGGSLPAR